MGGRKNFGQGTCPTAMHPCSFQARTSHLIHIKWNINRHYDGQNCYSFSLSILLHPLPQEIKELKISTLLLCDTNHSPEQQGQTSSHSRLLTIQMCQGSPGYLLFYKLRTPLCHDRKQHKPQDK